MDVMEAIKKRYSVRSYQDRAVETEKLDSILEAARLAPSASNRQEWRFIVVRDKDIRQRLMQAAKDQAFVGQAPVVIAACAKTDSHVMTCGQQSYPIDVAIAIEHMALKATEEGLGTCWIGAFKEEEISRVINAPEGMCPVALIPVGYPNEAPAARSRRPISEIMHKETF